MRGDNVTFTCPPGLTLTGPYKSIYMGNGEWEPDPREAECKGEIMNTNIQFKPKLLMNKNCSL